MHSKKYHIHSDKTEHLIVDTSFRIKDTAKDITTMKYIVSLSLIAAALLLTGCATSLPVQVNAIADSGLQPASTRYVLVNGNAESHEDDLFFREFSGYFVRILANKGYQRVDSRDQADIEILFRYGVSDGRTGIRTFSRPIYESIGGRRITYTETKTDATGNATTTKGSIYTPIQHQYVGTTTESHSYTVFTSTAILEAHIIKHGDTQPDNKPRLLWTTTMNSTNASNDLRAIMPVMATAAAPYLAGNSGIQQTIRLKPDDPKVQAMRMPDANPDTIRKQR